MQGGQGMSEDISNNNPKKEFLFALMGIGLFLGIVLLIGISGFLRPAGQHISAEPTEVTAATDEAEAISAEDTATAAAEATATEDTAAATVADTTAPVTDDVAVATDSATASAEDTVSQVAVAEAEVTTEPAEDTAAASAEDTAIAQ